MIILLLIQRKHCFLISEVYKAIKNRVREINMNSSRIRMDVSYFNER